MKLPFSSLEEPSPAPERPVSAGAPRFQVWILAIVLALGTIALYWPVTHHEFVSYDDGEYVGGNKQVQQGLTLENLKWAFLHTVCSNWHPVTMLSHMLDCQMYGLDAGKHHLTNVLLHALASVLLLLALRRLTGVVWRSAMVAALFAVHPLHVESVAWLAERKDVLSACFGFSALYFYARYARAGKVEVVGASPEVQPPVPHSFNSTDYWLAWSALALGLLSKPMLVTWPFVLLLLDFWPLGRLNARTWRALVMEKIPGFALIVACSIMAYAVQTTTGAADAMRGMPITMRFANALVSYGLYVLKSVWPHDLAFYYPFLKSLPSNWVVLAAIFLCAASAGAWITRKSHPYILTGWFWFLGTLVPVIGLVQVGTQAMADRYTYIPSIGLFILAVWGLFELSRGWRYPAPILSGAGALVIVICAVLTRQQISYWQNSEILYRHALSVTRDNILTRINLGVVLREQGRIDDAIIQFKDAIRIYPDCVDAHNELGYLFARQGHTNEAMAELGVALRIKPDFYKAHENIGNILANSGNADAAIPEYEETIHLEPDYAEPHNNLGILFAAKGQSDYATDQYREAIRLNPDYANAHFNLGQLLAQQGRTDDAAKEFEAAIKLQPSDTVARQKLAQLLDHGGQTGASLDQLQAAVQQNPNDAELHFKLGNLCARKGQADAAISEFQTAIRLKPDFAEAHSNLGNLLSAAGRTSDALSQFQEAIRLKPDFRDAHYNLASALLKGGQLDAAIGQFQIVTQLSPAFAPAHYYLGICLARQGRADEAISQFQTVIQLKPDAAAHEKLGLIFADKGKLDDAMAQFQEALRLSPNYGEAATNLARVKELKNGMH